LPELRDPLAPPPESATKPTGAHFEGFDPGPGRIQSINGNEIVITATRSELAEINGETAATDAGLVAQLGTILTRGEGNYESYNSGTQYVKGGKVGFSNWRHPQPGDVTSFTIDEILATAPLSGNNSARRFATGKYQTVIPTLRYAKTALGLSGSELYSPALQERVFQEYLLKKAGGVLRADGTIKAPGALYNFVVKGSGSPTLAQYAAAQEWASIAVPAGYKTGVKDRNGNRIISNGRMSYYMGSANSANMRATNNLISFLNGIRR